MPEHSDRAACAAYMFPRAVAPLEMLSGSALQAGGGGGASSVEIGGAMRAAVRRRSGASGSTGTKAGTPRASLPRSQLRLAGPPACWLAAPLAALRASGHRVRTRPAAETPRKLRKPSQSSLPGEGVPTPRLPLVVARLILQRGGESCDRRPREVRVCSASPAPPSPGRGWLRAVFLHRQQDLVGVHLGRLPVQDRRPDHPDCMVGREARALGQGMGVGLRLLRSGGPEEQDEGERQGFRAYVWSRFEVRSIGAIGARGIRQPATTDCHRHAARMFFAPPEANIICGEGVADDRALLQGGAPQVADFLQAWRACRSLVAFRLAEAQGVTTNFIYGPRHAVATSRRAFRSMVRPIALAIRARKRQALGAARSLCLSLDDRGAFRVIRYKADLDPEATPMASG